MIFAATGHRPEKLGGYSDEVDAKLRRLATGYLQRLSEPPEAVISGMALGWDMAWAEAALSLNIRVIAAVPFLGQEARWPKASQYRYRHHIAHCEKVVIHSGGYTAWKMLRRNDWMVDHCGTLVALWNGAESGGTWNCLQYAWRKGRKVVNLWPEWEKAK